MYELVKNDIGKNRLTDEEFKKYYDYLWEATPHFYSNWPTDEEISKLKEEFQIYYNSDESILEIDGEKEEWAGPLGHYYISTFGRIKYDDKFLKQDDVSKQGYLVLLKPDDNTPINTTTCVYTFVAKMFMGKKDGDGLHVHHIDNNGYDCRLKNLILLTPAQHNAVHRNRKLNKEQLKDALSPKKRYSEDKIKLHLADYKNNNITTECGKWQNDRFYSHLLPETEIRKNLIDISYKKNFDNLFLKMKEDLHIYFSSLASSQALCFNLFYPLSEEAENRLDLINSHISKNATSEFEHVEDNSFEKYPIKKGKTNFDFFIKDGSKKFFFEIKYTEDTFGYVSEIDPTHHQKFNDYYKNQLEIVAPKVSERDFFNNYQLWRNICHVYENEDSINEVYFVVLKDRTDLIQDVEDAKKKCNKIFKDHIHVLKIEELVKKVLDEDNEALHNHYLEFFDKYLDY